MSQATQEPAPTNPPAQPDVMEALLTELKAFVDALEKDAETTQTLGPEIPADVPRFVMEY